MKKKKTLIAGVQLNIHYTASVSMNHESLLTNLFDLIWFSEKKQTFIIFKISSFCDGIYGEKKNTKSKKKTNYIDKTIMTVELKQKLIERINMNEIMKQLQREKPYKIWNKYLKTYVFFISNNKNRRYFC